MTEDKIENTCDDLKNALLGLYENGDNDEDRKTVHATQK